MNQRQRQAKAARRAAHAARRDSWRPPGSERLSVQRRRARDERRKTKP